MESTDEMGEDKIPSEDEGAPRINKINSMQNDALIREASIKSKVLSPTGMQKKNS